MPRLLIGVDSLNIGCIKIMKDNADNPYSTPDADYGKFYFNSKWDMNVRFVGTDKLTVSDPIAQFYPAGTNKNTFKRYRLGQGQGYNDIWWKNEYWQELGQLDYELPLHDLRPIDGAGWTIYCSIQKSTGTLDTRWYSYNILYAGWIKGWYLNNGSDFPLSGVPITALCGYCETSTWGPGRGIQAIVYNLPGNEDEIFYPPKTPVAGQKVVQITKDFCRVAKPGYDVTDIAAKLAFDSSTRPAKIIASGDIALPSGVTTVFDFSEKLAGISIPDGSSIVVDVIQYKGSTIVFPASIPNDEDDYGCPYRVFGQTIQFANGGSACRARFIVLAQDNSAASVGSNKVFRQTQINGQDVFQFIRPGASDPPTLADVIIDSRWPCLQIIKTGVFDIPASGGAPANTDIAFDSADLFPFVKYCTIHPAGVLPWSNSLGGTFSDVTMQGAVRSPSVAAGFVRNGDTGAKTSYISGETTVCQLTSNRARFVTYRGGPYRMLYDGGVVTRAVKSPATKIRYYIFGIPA